MCLYKHLRLEHLHAIFFACNCLQIIIIFKSLALLLVGITLCNSINLDIDTSVLSLIKLQTSCTDDATLFITVEVMNTLQD